MNAEKLHVDCPFEIKAANDDGHIVGHGAVFGNVDLGFDRLEKGAFDDWLDKRDKQSPPVPMLWQHSTDDVIGLWEDMSPDTKGLVVKGKLNLDVQRAREARSLAVQGAVKGLSIGYIPRDYDIEENVRVLKRVDVLEVSLVTFPMNPEANVVDVKDISRAEWVKILRTHGGLTKNQAEAFVAKGIHGLRAEKRERRQDERSEESQELNEALAAARDVVRRLRISK